MNAFELFIEPIQGKPNRLQTIVKIDGVDFLSLINKEFNALVFDRLVESAQGSGRYLIFTCSCGDAECGGWDKVTVFHRVTCIEWTFVYHYKLYQFKFNKQIYKGEIAQSMLALSQFGPDYIIEPQRIIEPKAQPRKTSTFFSSKYILTKLPA